MKKRIGIILYLVTMMALLASVACGGSATALIPTQPTPTETPIKGAPPAQPDETATPQKAAPTETPETSALIKGPEILEKVVMPAPIEDAKLELPAGPGGRHTLMITSGLPSGCAEFNDYQ